MATDGDAAGLAEEMLRLAFEAEPMIPTLLGLPGYDDRMADRSAATEQRYRAALVKLADRAEDLSRSTVDGASALTATVAAQQARAQVDKIDARAVEYAISDRFVSPVAELLALLPMVTLADATAAENLLTRLRAVPGFLDQVTERHREGLAAGLTPVGSLVGAAVAHLDRYLTNGPAALLATQAVPADRPSFADERTRVLADIVWPAIQRYRDTLADEFVAAGRPEDRGGLCWLPGGDGFYAGLVRVHTTTDRTPEELHRTGLDVMARVAEEFTELGDRVFGTGDRTTIFARLRDDPALRWADGDELLAAARATIERAEAAAPQWFGRVPEQRCRVEPVPPADAPGAPGAYYVLASLDGRRPGTYFANTHKAQERARYLSEVTAFHEAVPGHHFQHSRALELEDLPLLRRLADVTAYGEGWGLYCERLADEMGLYSGDLDRLGMLTNDSMRAGRLVVDTGLHAKGWSRQQAIDYLTANTPRPVLEIVSEVDRYLADPGQALAYMVGRLEIERIRAGAQRRLGDRFDIRAFHDRLLGDGPLPLSVLDRMLSGWAEAQLGTN